MFAFDEMSNCSNESDDESAYDSGTDVPSTEQFIKSLGSWSHFRCPELIVPEAFIVGPGRVLNQIAAATSVPVETVLAIFKEMNCETDWELEHGFTPREILRYAKYTDVGCYVYIGGRLETAELARNKDKPAIVFAVFCGLVYFYKGMGARARDDAQGLQNRVPKPRRLCELVKSNRHPPKSVEEMVAFPWDADLATVPAGSYWIPSVFCGDDGDTDRHLTGLLVKFLKSKRYPRVNKVRYPGNMDKPFEITYHKVSAFDEGSGTIVVRSHAKDVSTIAAWARRLNVPYSGTSLGPFTNIALDTVLRRKQRRYLKDSEKEQVIGRQRGCNLCGDAIGSDGVFDHVIPLHSMTSKQDTDAFQYLCGQCNANKTVAEEKPCIGVLRSHFNQSAWDSYVLSPKPPCMQYKDVGLEEYPHMGPAGQAYIAEHLAVDIVRSRYAALYNVPEPGLPIYTAIDDIREVTPEEELPDLIYIELAKKPRNINEITSLLPFTGNAWYPRPAVEYLLHTKKATWSDLKWGIKATSHMPGDELRAAFDVMEAAWADVVASGESPDRRTPAKDSINCWVGFTGMAGSVSLKAKLSFEPDPCASSIGHSAYGVKGLYENTNYIEVLDSGTYRPIYDWCLAVEHTRIAQAYQAVQAVFTTMRLPCNLLHLVVDGFIFEKPRKNTSADKIREVIDALTIGSFPRLEERIRTSLAQADPKQKRLKTTDLYPISGHDSEAKAYRVVTPQARQHLRGPHSIEKVFRSWQIDYKRPQWNDLETEAAKEHVRSGGSLCVLGLAGVGKSHLIREMVEELEVSGKKVVIVAKTHNAAQVAGGDTVDSFVWRHVREGATGADVIWVDQISMLDIGLLQDLNHASFRKPPIQWILSGDFNQYAPFFQSFLGKPVVKNFEESDLLHLLTGGNRLTLTQCRRSDEVLFDWYASIVKSPLGRRHHQSIQETVAQARAEFTIAKAVGFIPGSRLSPTNLVISHRLREEVNSQCNMADVKGREGAQWLTKEEFKVTAVVGTNNPQDAFFWTGQCVVASCRGRKLKNGREYEILELGETVALKSGEELVSLKRADFFKSMRLRYAITYASAQGLTLQGLLALHDTGNEHFDWKKLYVGLSRATAKDQVVVF